ncbi:MAG: hypothetical protein GC158_07465 [Cyanobacteria bacterium RI_101]|nr:hypothetical protein [Cyanobacteria bacterium RI_101]
MELANLISVAYNEYEVWDSNEDLQDPQKLPTVITGSSDFADLQTNTLECQKEAGKNTNFTKLDKLWKTSKKYDRLESFFFPQWWWFELLEPDHRQELLRTDIREFWEEIKDIVTTDQVFGFIARSQDNPRQLFVVFRGTREGAEWFNNFRPKPQPFLPELSQELGVDLGEVRNGFNLIYTAARTQNILEKFLDRLNFFSIPLLDSFANQLQKKVTQFFADQDTIPSQTVIEQFFTDYFQNNPEAAETEIYITGHSLGAGLASLAALHIQKLAEKHQVSPAIKLYTFASPRVGNETFASHFDPPHSLKSYRIINSEDLIQSVPLPTTELIDDETRKGMSAGGLERLARFKEFLERLTKGQSQKHYQHIGVPVTFTQQTGTIAGNHNLTNTYRRALVED